MTLAEIRRTLQLVPGPLPTPCHIWPRSKNNHGYGRVQFNGEVQYVHRVLFTIAKGPIAPGFDLDHLCRTPACANEEHLEAVPHRENCRRGIKSVRHWAKTHCSRGHEYTPENTSFRKERAGSRRCLVCKREYARRQRVTS